MIICFRCKIPKEDDQFAWRSKTQQTRNGECKECVNKYAMAYREKNKEKIAFSYKKWRVQNREKYLEYNKEKYRNNREFYLQYRKEYYQKNIDKLKEDAREYQKRDEVKKRQILYNKKKNLELKIKVYDSYGGRLCCCCGESEIKFLTIDHIYGCEPGQRKAEGVGTDLYRFLIKNNFPSGYRILCYNCNIGRSKNNDVCPHEEKTCHVIS